MKQGGKEYNMFLRGERLTRKQTMLAQCYVCNGETEGGMDCQGSESCPLYAFMPYRKTKKKARKKISPEARIKLCKNLERARKAKYDTQK